ncbi:MAG: hypothetical protein CMM08_14070 [Rhodospirillaceae bacterium]|jgi:GNAT superfamily N-acetyltransferase|nr:hypothetical protein [Rhodospirillaceae bacterium]|tara:strand:+ start:2845 stop:3714 length:870 start_codon:yes stop_codon:yes gene_type:complete
MIHEPQFPSAARWAFARARRQYIELLRRAGYDCQMQFDMAGWVDWRRAQGGQTTYSFDPEYNRLSPANSFWIAARYIGSDPVRQRDTLDGLAAVGACRLFETGDLVELVASGRLWFREATARRTELAPGLPLIGGRVGHHGGLFVRQAHRRQGLPVALSRLARFSIAERWAPDWDSGLLTQDPPPGRDMVRKYGFGWDLPLVRGWSAARRGPAAVNLLLLNRAGLIDQARRDAVLVDLYDGGDPRDALAAIVERTEEPDIALRPSGQHTVDAGKDGLAALGAGHEAVGV